MIDLHSSFSEKETKTKEEPRKGEERKNAAMPKSSTEEKLAKKEDLYSSSLEKKKQEKEETRSGKKNPVNREIVRISGVDLNGNLRIDRALKSIKGIGARAAKVFAVKFCDKTNLPNNTLLGNIPIDKDELLNDIVSKCELPGWMVNRQRDLYSGESKHLTGSDLIFAIREDKQRLSRIKSRRGMRLLAGLPVRGQRTRSNFRRRQGVVGVMKKAAVPGKAAPKMQQTPTPKAKAEKR